MNAEMIHRLHFAFTVTFHYLFPQLTMGLALLIVVLKTVALRTGSEEWDRAARFWGRIFGINFVFGVVTGIPMEFEFGTNWARFSRLSGGVIGQPLAMEGVFSFFLESAFLGLFLYGEKRISQAHALVLGGHGLAGLVDLRLLHHRHRRVDAASCGLRPAARRAFRGAQLLATAAESLGALLQYVHNMTGAVVTASLRHGRRRRLLSAGRSPRRVRPHLPQGGRNCRRHFDHPHHLSHRRSCTANTWRAISPRPLPPWRASSRPRPARASCSWASPTKRPARSTIPSWSTMC